MQQNISSDDYVVTKRIRNKVVRAIYSANACHYNSNLSATELIYSIYKYFVVPGTVDFILSKPHAAPTLYAVMHEFQLISDNIFDSFCKNKSKMLFLPTRAIDGIHIGLGAVGQGFPIGMGMAIGYKYDKNHKKIVVLMGDGELNEGSVWEGIMFASHYKVNNLLVIIDLNGMQASGYTKDILDNKNIKNIVTDFGWDVFNVKGHDIAGITSQLLTVVNGQKKPIMIFADTIKGKGLSFVEGNPGWHYRKMNVNEYQQALMELAP